MRRFNDTYHNESVIAKAGIVYKPWADRLMVGFNYSHMYKDIQTGVWQEIVYGAKHRHGHTLMTSLEYSKRNLLTEGLDVALNVTSTLTSHTPQRSATPAAAIARSTTRPFGLPPTATYTSSRRAMRRP